MLFRTERIKAAHAVPAIAPGFALQTTTRQCRTTYWSIP